jgi:arylsulfatase A-like enzyme
MELLPTYGTAWLLLAALTAPLFILIGLILGTRNDSRLARIVRASLTVFSVGVAAIAIVGAVSAGLFLWLRSFGLLTEVDPRNLLIAFSVCAGAGVAFTRRGRTGLMKQYSVAKFGTVIGALALLSLPFRYGGYAQPGLPVSDVPTAAMWPSRPNILLVTIDTLSAQHMSLYGSVRPTTPNLEVFARGATTFDRAYANANFTTAGISSILTATRPWTHRAVHLPGWPIAEVRGNSLPALLHEAGYKTGYVATNSWAGATRIGLGQYFDFAKDAATTLSVCHDRLTAILRYDCVASELLPFRFAQLLAERIHYLLFDRPPNWQFDPRLAMRPALEWLQNDDKRAPLFLWVHLMPPHSPYAAPAPWLGHFDGSPAARTSADSEMPAAYLYKKISKQRVQVLEARYDEAIEYVDNYVGEFLKQALPLLGDNTAVVITADHGESFANGYGMHTGPGLFESIIHIPLIIKFPHQVQAARTSLGTEQVDIAPTLAELARLTPPRLWEGRSLLGNYSSVGAAEIVPAAKVIYAMNFEQNGKRMPLTTGSVAAIDGNWKLVHYMGPLHYPLMPRLNDELYDLSVDPGETASKMTEQPAEGARLLGLVSAELARRGGPLP